MKLKFAALAMMTMHETRKARSLSDHAARERPIRVAAYQTMTAVSPWLIEMSRSRPTPVAKAAARPGSGPVELL